MEDIETILNTLIYDGKVEMTIIAAKEGTVGCVDGQMKLYRGVNAIIQPTGLVKTPCGLCPVNVTPTNTQTVSTEKGLYHLWKLITLNSCRSFL